MNFPLIASILLILSIINVYSQEKNAESRVFAVPDVNGRATLLVRPSLSGEAMLDNDGTTLTLKIVVEENGNVLSANCSATCPAAVVGPAEVAAKASKFRPLIVDGQAVKYN